MVHDATAGTLLGCAPNNWLAVNAGQRLAELKSLSELADVKMLVYSFVVGTVALAPLGWKYIRSRKERDE